jgi:hypothetical protein
LKNSKMRRRQNLVGRPSTPSGLRDSSRSWKARSAELTRTYRRSMLLDVAHSQKPSFNIWTIYCHRADRRCDCFDQPIYRERLMQIRDAAKIHGLPPVRFFLRPGTLWCSAQSGRQPLPTTRDVQWALSNAWWNEHRPSHTSGAGTQSES